MRTKSILFSNFQFNQSNNNNRLVIDEMYNVNTNNGFIQSELSIKNFLINLFDINSINLIESNNSEIISNITKFIPYEFFNETLLSIQTRIFAITSNNVLYELNHETFIFEERYTFSIKPNGILSKNSLYFFDENNKCVVITQNNILSIEEIPFIETFAYSQNHLYFSLKSQPNKIYIADNIELKEISSNLTQYSFIEISIENGKINKLTYIKNKLFIFTQYSILRLDEDENIAITQNKVNSLIYKNSLIQIDDSVIFYSSNGLYIFDGTDTKQLFDDIYNISKNADFIYFNHKLYIFNLENKNIVLSYNFNYNQITPLRLENIFDLYQINNYSTYNLFAVKNENNSFEIFSLYNNNSNTSKQYVKFKTNFLDSDKLKQIKNIHIKCTGSFQLKITSDTINTIFNISNSTSLNNISLNGIYFDFEIFSDIHFKLESILLTYDEIGE